jgi:Fe-Mn family superoxide dismutase
MFYRKPLYYSLNSLEPFIDERTMNEHYNVHYKKYTDNLNSELVFSDGSIATIKNILKDYKNYSIKIRNNGGGYYNHFLYFENLSPYQNNYELYANQSLKNSINTTFGSFENFKENFIKVGSEVFGSGWVWLIKSNDNGKLYIVPSANQDNPIMLYNCKVLLGMDVWEHAYYLKHLADRKSYMDDFFKVIDWKVVSERQ